MLIPGTVEVHLALEPVSLLKSIDGLCAEIERRFAMDPMKGHIFAFVNRAHTGVKLIYWDHGGFVLVYKRLERGRFQIPALRGDRVKMTAAQLGALLDGMIRSEGPVARPANPGVESARIGLNRGSWRDRRRVWTASPSPPRTPI